MTAVVLAGLLAGWAVAVPVGPVAAYLVALSARTGWRTGAAAALGVAAADGLYALLAALGGTGLVQVVRPATGPARWLGAVVLLTLAVHGAVTALRGTTGPADGPVALTPRRAFARLLALTLVNPATVLVFAALVVGSDGAVAADPVSALVFAGAAMLASAAWQLLLATSGAALGGLLTGRRGRLATALSSSAVMAVLALALALPGGLP